MNDQTGYGYSPGGFAPRPDDAAAAARMKHEMDRLSDMMAQIDPTIQRSLATFARAQVREGSDPAAVRRAAYGSVSGQVMTDTLMGLRRTGFLGHGDPINYAANVMQGVAGGGFNMDMVSPGGRSSGMGQMVSGAGLLTGQVGAQMSRDVLTNL